MKKRALLIIAGIFGVLVVGMFGFAAYIGFFSTPKVTEMMVGPYTYIYEEFIGDYNKSGPVFDKVYNALKEKGIVTTKGLGVYFDDPAIVPADKLRSYCGVVIENDDLNRISEFETKFKVGKIARNKKMVIEFPVKNGLSYMVGPMKCYPAFMKYTRENNYKPDALSFEVYDEPAQKILFVMEIEVLQKNE